MEADAVLLGRLLAKQKELDLSSFFWALARCSGVSQGTSCGWCGVRGAVVSREPASPQLASSPGESIRCCSLPALLKGLIFKVSGLMAVPPAAWVHQPRNNPEDYRAESCQSGITLNWKQLLKHCEKLGRKFLFCILEEMKKEWRARPVSSTLLWRKFSEWKFECILWGLTSGRVENLGDGFRSRSR